MQPTIRIIPTLNYKAPKKAMAWLEAAFGFQEHALYEDEKGQFVHGELTLLGNMIMIGKYPSDTIWGQHLKHPQDIGHFVTQSAYVIIDDDHIDAHYDQAVSQGAKILDPLKAEDYGGKSYLCKDPEGHMWSFGSYNPWQTA